MIPGFLKRCRFPQYSFQPMDGGLGSWAGKGASGDGFRAARQTHGRVSQAKLYMTKHEKLGPPVERLE